MARYLSEFLGFPNDLSPPEVNSLTYISSLAISHALETTSVGRVPCEITKYHGLTQPNPYVLPWIMRGLLEEDVVRTELSSETEELLRRFDDWEPKTKPLQNVKYRLEAVRSKL